jgi:LEA14-like dessication related protein
MNKALKTTGLFGLIIGLGFLIYSKLRTNVKKALHMTEFTLKGLSIGKLSMSYLKGVPVKASLLITNPSGIAITIKSYTVELYKVKNGEKEKLAKTPISAITIPANGSVVNNVLFNVDYDAITNLISGAISNGIESQLKGKIIILVKADVLGQYIQQEIKY